MKSGNGVKNTIKSANEIAELFKKAQKFSTGHLLVIIADANQKRDPHGRVAFIAGKKLGTSPQRNRAKRLMREAARQLKAPWIGIDVIFVAKPRIQGAELTKIVKEMDTIRRKTLRAE